MRAADIEAVRVVEVEVANFRAARNWGLITDNPELYLEIPAVFGYWYYQMGRNDEMAGWLEAALERDSAPSSPLFPVALAIAAEAAQVSGDDVLRDEYSTRLGSLELTQELPDDAVAYFDMKNFYAQVSHP